MAYLIKWYLLTASLSATTKVAVPSNDRTILAFSITQCNCISGLVVSPKFPARE